MWISNNAVRLGVFCGCGLCGVLLADDLTLADGACLTGTVRSIDEAGVVELVSELSPAPLRLKKEAVEKVAFSAQGAAPQAPSAVVELTNGDLLPATIEALDDQKLTLVSPEAGRLEIPRAGLKSLQLGIRQLKVVYAGPRSLEEWTRSPDEVKNWVFGRAALIANGQATASKNVTLPQQFILRFTLKWQPKQNPNFQVYFADPLKKKGELCDRYYLQFNGAGLEIKREAANGNRYNTLKLFNRTPNQYADPQLQVELRVDRKGARMQLVLNGETEGEFADPIPAVPGGSGITLVCNAQNGSPQEISHIEICEFDDLKNRHYAEDRGDPQTDSLISREDDRWGGHLIDIRKTDAGPVFRFKNDFRNDVLEIPAADVSTVFFALKDGKPADFPPPPFVLRLCGDGSLGVSSCQFTGDTVAAVHPLLGRINILRQGVVAMERTDSKPKTAPNP